MTARQALELSIRPQLEIKTLPPPKFLPQKGVDIDFRVRNAGPGSILEIGYNILVDVCRGDPAACFSKCPGSESAPTVKSPWSMESDAERTLSLSNRALVLLPVEIEKMERGTIFLYMCGILTGNDILAKLHKFPFCHGYDGNRKQWALCAGGWSGREK
jgi:hypothetical protein